MSEAGFSNKDLVLNLVNVFRWDDSFECKPMSSLPGAFDLNWDLLEGVEAI